MTRAFDSRRPPMPVRELPDRADLQQLRRQAKELLTACRAGEPEALRLVAAHDRGTDTGGFALHDTQRVLARSYGFSSWAKLKAHVDGVTVTRLAEAVRGGDAATAGTMLRERPELLHMNIPGEGERRVLHLAVLQRDAPMVRLMMAAGADARQGVYPHRAATTAHALAGDRGFVDIVQIIEEEERARQTEMACPNTTVSPTQERLHEAIRCGHDEAALEMTDEDASLIHACDRHGDTPLHAACKASRERIIHDLLGRRPPLSKPNAAGHTPLECLIRHGGWNDRSAAARTLELARLLRARGAGLTPIVAAALDERDRLLAMLERDPHLPERVTAIHNGGLLSFAVKFDRLELLATLLKRGLDVDERCRVDEEQGPVYSWGGPLWHAAGWGRYEAAESLLAHGADPNAQVYASGSPMSQAYGRRDERMLDLLRRYGGVADVVTIGLHRDVAAAKAVLLDPQRAVLAEGHFHGETGVEQLLWAGACGGSEEIVAMTLPHVDWRSDDPRWFDILDQPLRFWNHGPGHWALNDDDRDCYARCMRRLIERGIDVNVEGRFGRRILHVICDCGSTWGRAVMTEAERAQFATMLLDAGSRLDGRDELLQSTPLGWACRFGRLNVARLLIERGAPVHEADAEPWTQPLAWAERMGHDDLVDLLRERRR